MSEFHVEVVEIGKMSKHENADSLSVVHVRDYPVIVRTADFKEGDKAVYIPVDSVVPPSDRFAFLGEHRRIKARKLRGVFSMGLLVPAEWYMTVGENVAELWDIKKYEPPEEFTMRGEDESPPGFIPTYTDIEGYRRWPDILKEGEPVIITEKIHGANGRFCWKDGRLWCGSHKNIKRRDPNNLWWKTAIQYGLEEKLSRPDGIVFFGEVYGSVQSLRYGHEKGKISLAFFDAFSVSAGRYFDADKFREECDRLGLPTVPLLACREWSKSCLDLAEGKSTMPGADHVREGIVIKPMVERFDDRVGRVILKHIGEGYMVTT